MALTAMVAAAGLCLQGCGGQKMEPGVVFPAEKPLGPTLDIQVAREATRVTLTNTTARGFGACRLWLNQWYSRSLPGLKVGESLRLALSEFRDEHGEAFRGGGFFATRAADRLVTAHLETGDQMVRLIVVRAKDD